MSLEVFVVMKPGVTVTGRAHIARDGKSVASECLTAQPDHADLVALEEALKLWEAGLVSQVIAIMAGPALANDILSYALAMGADRAIHVATGDDLFADARVLGHLIAAVVAHHGGRFILTGAGSADGDGDVLPHMIAQEMGAACLTNIDKLKFLNGELKVERRIEKGHRQIWNATLPAVVACHEGANSPRYVPVTALVLARNQAVTEIDPGALGINQAELRPGTSLEKFVPPRTRPKRIAAAATQSVAERMQAAVSGGVGDTKKGQSLSGSPEQIADQIVAFLEQRGLLGEQRQ